MDAPLSPAERFSDAVGAFAFAADRASAAVEIFTCELLLLGLPPDYHPEDDGPILP